MLEGDYVAPDEKRSLSVRAGGFTLSAALHVLLVLTQLTFGELVPASAAGAASMETPVAPAPRSAPTAEVVAAPPEDENFPGLKPLGPPDDVPEFTREYSDVTVENASFDLSHIAERAQVLFPFISPGLSLDLFALKPQDTFTEALHNRLLWTTDSETPREPARALDMTPAAIQQLIDRTWARRDRWTAAQPLLNLVTTHDASAGQGASLIRAYAEQNLGQYYDDPLGRGPDARFWTELALAADHVDFIRFVREYVSAHPGTESATELLFVLDKIIESNRNVLATLQKVEPALELRDTRRRSKEAIALAEEIQRHYDQVLDRKALRSVDDVTVAYSIVRLAVLEGILRTTPDGYRANDARLLMGTIHWYLSDKDKALGAWCGIGAGRRDEYNSATGDLVSVLRAPAAADICATGELSLDQKVAIDRVLQRERVRKWEFQYRRILSFGYSLDKF